MTHSKSGVTVRSPVCIRDTPILDFSCSCFFPDLTAILSAGSIRNTTSPAFTHSPFSKRYVGLDGFTELLRNSSVLYLQNKTQRGSQKLTNSDMREICTSKISRQPVGDIRKINSWYGDGGAVGILSGVGSRSVVGSRA